MEKSKIMEALFERIGKLEDWRKKGESKGKKQKEDEDVCLTCGGDLQFVEDGIVYCPKCKEYFELGEEKNAD